jgi:hypothetical protein
MGMLLACKLLLYLFLIESILKVAGDVTKHEPPNTTTFNGAQDGHLTSSKPQGHTGPRNASPSGSMSSNGTTALVLTTMLPLLTSYLVNTQSPPVAISASNFGQ